MVSGKKREAWRGRLALGAIMTVTASCAKIVGITDTVVETAGAAGLGAGGSGAAGGSGGTGGHGAQAGATTGGATTGGATNTGGAMHSGGATSTGGDSMGGSVSSGGSTAGSPAGGKGGDTGAGGSTGGTGGSAGGKGGSATGGKGGKGGAGGSAGTTAGGGEGGVPSDCGSITSQCTSDGKLQVCQGGSLVTMACPLDKPACDAGACVNRGPTMVKVESYYVDSTEVTVADYNAFVTAKNGDTSGQPAACSWNTKFEPSGAAGPDDLPVSYVDWCDATAYCSWAGKHLCRGIGDISLSKASLFDATKSQWFLACGGGGFHPNADHMCNSSGGNTDTAPVGTYPGCEGYYPGLFDMEGNVAEWVDVCDDNTGASDYCYPLGGSTIDNESFCDEEYDMIPRSDAGYTIGFRCCSG